MQRNSRPLFPHRSSWLLSILVILSLTLPMVIPGAAAAPPPSGIWRDIRGPLEIPADQQAGLPTRYRLLAADEPALRSILATAPLEGAGGEPALLILPLPDGTPARFQIEEYSMMEPGLAARYPSFTTYLGRGIDDPTATVRASWTSQGLNAAIQSTAGRFYVAPYRRGDTAHYIAFDARDKVVEEEYAADDVLLRPEYTAPRQAHVAQSNTLLHNYLLALATTGEYSQQAAPGGTVADVLAVLVATINEVNGIYEENFSIRLFLIANEDAIIYLDGATDPYTDADKYALLDENQAVLDAVVGSANYDIGHVFRSASSGVATLGVPCVGGLKARGTSSGSVNMTSHEMGHQFGANHTQNAGDCGRAPEAAYEPGSGSTIMSYAGQCDQSVLDAGEGGSLYFHTVSFDEVIDYITSGAGATCGSLVNPGNTAPLVEAGAGYTIPRGTPFSLAGSGSDPDGDPLVYLWEEFDLGPEPITTTMPNTDEDGYARPIFRSFPATGSPTRIFPRLNSILDGSNQGPGEALPSISRTMTFRLTARDGRGGETYDSTSVTVVGTAGPFQITSPDGVTFWPRGSQQTILWDVANTTAAPVNCSAVNILLSTDQGQSFTYTLAANTPNDGSEVVTVPDLDPVGLLFKVECTDNIFFDINRYGATACMPLFDDDHEQGFDGWTITDGETNLNPWQAKTDGGFSGSNYFYVSDANQFYTDSYLDSPTIVVAGDPLVLSFVHEYEMETKRGGSWASDAGVVEISVNGGAWTGVDRGNFIQNPYNLIVTTTNYSPIGGRWAFSGSSRGYVQSLVDLSSLVSAGDSVQIRFRQAKDGWTLSGDEKGWLVDDVSICRGDPVPVLSLVKTVDLAGLPIEPGDTLTYTIVVANTGSADAAGVHVTDTLPAGVAGADLDQVVDVAAGSSVTLHIPVTVTAGLANGTVIENTAFYAYPSATACLPETVCRGMGEATFVVGVRVYLPVVIRSGP